MSWSRFDDRWVERPVWESLDYPARWHYLCLVQYCSRNDRYDGVVPTRLALRCSDIPDPDDALQALAAHGLIKHDDEWVVLLQIDEHIPPPHIRENAEKSRVRMQRMRAHKNGDHALCLPEHCPDAPVTPPVTRNTGTGQDGLPTVSTGDRERSRNQ